MAFSTNLKSEFAYKGTCKTPIYMILTLTARTLRALMVITAAFDLEAVQWDVANAFINGILEESVYCECPEDFQESGKCLQFASISI